MEQARPFVEGNLDIDARRAFLTHASHTIEHAEGTIEVDCTRIDSVEAPTVGMLVQVARQAQRRGQRIALAHPSARLRQALDEAGASCLFSWVTRSA